MAFLVQKQKINESLKRLGFEGIGEFIEGEEVWLDIGYIEMASGVEWKGEENGKIITVIDNRVYLDPIRVKLLGEGVGIVSSLEEME